MRALLVGMLFALLLGACTDDSRLDEVADDEILRTSPPGATPRGEVSAWPPGDSSGGFADQPSDTFHAARNFRTELPSHEVAQFYVNTLAEDWAEVKVACDAVNFRDVVNYRVRAARLSDGYRRDVLIAIDATDAGGSRIAISVTAPERGSGVEPDVDTAPDAGCIQSNLIS